MVEYFSHDYHARHDPKLQHLQQELKMEGIGVFWCLVEFCYEQGGRILDTECERIAFDMRTQCDVIRRVLSEFGLFDFDGYKYTSKSILKRISHRLDISQKAANSAKIRWNNANAMRTQCEGNALKEIKLKESKVKEIKEKKEDHQPDKPVESSWRTDFKIYEKEVSEAYDKLLIDTEWVASRKMFHPNLDIELTMMKAFNDFWGIESGWLHKKKSKAKQIDWKSTFNNALTLKGNQVWLPKPKI